MSPRPSLPSFFRDLASLLRALSEAIFVWPIFLSHHLWHSLTLASPSESLTPVGPSTHNGHEKSMHGHLGSDNRRTPRRTSRASRSTRRDSSTAKVRRDLTPTPTTTRSRSSSSTTPSYEVDRDTTPMPSLSRSGGNDDLRARLATSAAENNNNNIVTNITHARIASQPLPTSPPVIPRKTKHARHFSASTDGTFSSSEPDSVRGNSSAGSSRSSSFSSETSYSALFERPDSARRTHFRPHSFGLSNADLSSDTETGHSSGEASTVNGGEGSPSLGDILKLGERKKLGKEDRRKEWEQQRLVDAIERLQVSLLTIEDKEKEEPSSSPVSRQADTKVLAPAPTINVHSPPKPTLRINSPPSITIIPPPPQVYDSDMDDDDEEDMTPTPTVENAMPPFRLQQHPHPSSNSSPIFINPFAPPGSSLASASSSTITLTSHNTSPTSSSSSSPPAKQPSPKGSPTRRALKFLPGWDEKRSTSPSRLPALPSMKKLFGGHRGGKTRPHGGRTTEEGVVASE